MKKKSSIFLSFLPILVFLAIYAYINAYNIVTRPTPFYDWDESIYMQVGKEMVSRPSFIPLWQGQPWLEKPPLIPFVFGVTTLLPIQPEVSARLVSLLATLGVLLLIYIWAQRILKNYWLGTLTVAITAFNPIFVQRAQVVNGDTFLLAGWLGYLLFASNFWISFIFLFIGVMSKSLIGFYPAILLAAYHLYRYYFEKRKNELRLLVPILLQLALLSVWYIAMLAIYKGTFLEVHFQDHLIRRVTQSIESHFGQKTFYLDIILSQYGWYLVSLLAGALYIAYRFLKKKTDSNLVFSSLFLAPWFIFLNLTKTKIAWYLYPAIPVFPFLMVYPLSSPKLKRIAVSALSLAVICFLLYLNILQGNYFRGSYSQYDAYYRIATAAKTQCSRLAVLVSPTDRQTHDTLKNLGDLISTSDWYDSHPAMVYYSGIPTTFLYEKQGLGKYVTALNTKSCIAMEVADADDSRPELPGLSLIKFYRPLVLFQRN